MHERNLVHRDFHDGNILNKNNRETDKVDCVYISELRLCHPVKSFRKDDNYGVKPFIAPEVLRGKPYTPSSDIYSFSMIMWEFTSGGRKFERLGRFTC
jgi:serine/threonine protein kinase